MTTVPTPTVTYSFEYVLPEPVDVTSFGGERLRVTQATVTICPNDVDDSGHYESVKCMSRPLTQKGTVHQNSSAYSRYINAEFNAPFIADAWERIALMAVQS